MNISFIRSMNSGLPIQIFFPFIILELVCVLSNPNILLGGTENDGKGQPDDREDLQVLNESSVIIPIGDPDLDGLDNLQEYFAGTDPNESDTDGGGENDGSEILFFSQDPLDPSDDEIQAIPWVNAVAGVDEITLTFGTFSEYDYLKLYRSLFPGTGYVLVNQNIQPTGLYTDSGLTAGTTYYYRMIAIDNYGHGSRVSPTCSATPITKATPWNLFLPAIIKGGAE